MPRIHLDVDHVRQLPSVYSTTIPSDYLDAMGHMNVMWYTHLFSMGFVGLMKHLGLMELFDGSRDSGSFALENHVRYLSEVRAGHTIHIHPRAIARSEKRFHVLYLMTNEDRQDVSATYEMLSTYVNLKTRRTDRIPDTLAAPLDRLIEEHRQLSWDAPLCGVMTA